MGKTWTVECDGHEIVTQNGFFGEKLYIDGARCDDHFGLAIRSELRGVIKEADGSTRKVRADFTQGRFGLTVRCHVYVDGRYVGGDPLQEDRAS